MTWSNIPSHILHNIISNQEIREQKTSSLVSRCWYKEIAWLWRRNIAVRCSRLEADNSWLDMIESGRYYENLIVDDCIFGGTPCEIIKTIMTKRVSGAFSGLHSLSFYSEVKSVKLYKILKMLTDTSLRVLEIDCPLIECEAEFVPSLKEVEKLKLALDSDLPGILVNFRKLKALQLDVNGLGSLAEGLVKFINRNQDTLQELKMIYQCKKNIQLGVHLRHLRKLSIRGNWLVFKATLENLELLESLELLDVDIKDADIKLLVDRFPNLKKLSIHGDPHADLSLNCIQNILRNQNLQYLNLGNFYIQKGLLDPKLKEISLKHLEITNIKLNEDFLESIFKISKNLEELTLFKVRPSVFTMRTFKNIASMLSKIKSLKFIEINFRKGFDDFVKMEFPKLKTFHLEASTYPEEFLEFFHAPNLENCSLSDTKGSDNDYNKNMCVTWLSQNCPKISNLGLFCLCHRRKNLAIHTINEIAMNFKNLRKLHSGNHMTVEGLEIILKECKLLNYCLFNCERITFGSVYAAVKRVCEGKRISVLSTNEECKIYVDDLEIEMIL